MIGAVGLILPIFDVDIGWSCKKSPKKGDHIRVKRQLYYHHGIYVSDEEVIHFSAKNSDGIFDWSKCEVIVTTLQDFLSGGRLEVRRYLESEKKRIKDEEYIVKKAKSYIGKKGYNLFTNNCEHFANYCTMNKKISKQVDNLVGLQLPKTLAFSFMPRAMLFGGNLGLSLIFAALLSATSQRDSHTGKKADNKNSSQTKLKNEVKYKNKRIYPLKEDVKVKISVEKNKTTNTQDMYKYTYISDEEFDD